MAKTAKTSNILSAAIAERMADDARVANNTQVGDAILPISYITDIAEDLFKDTRLVLIKSIANSALFQAISLYGDLLVARSQPDGKFDELNVERLERRFHTQAGIYNYFKIEADTEATTAYDEPMDFDSAYGFVLAMSPKDLTGDDANYDVDFLKSIGLTIDMAKELDAEQYAKDLALFNTKTDHLKHNKSACRADVEGVDACTPDLLVEQVYRILQKVDTKMSAEVQRLYKSRAKNPQAFSKMSVITGDMPKIHRALEKIRKDYKGDSRVRLD